MEKATSTYNFAPLAPIVFIPDWGGDVSHDIPFSDGEDGIIEVKIENISPLFTRDGNIKSKDKCDTSKNDSPYSAHILMPDNSKLYYLPATSVKGMLRTITEILSLGKIRQYDDRFFGHREFDGKLAEGKRYLNKMNDVKTGWLYKEGESYFLTPCDGEYLKISHKEIRAFYARFKGENPNSWDNNQFGEKGMYPEYEKNGIVYRIVCTGKMNKKNNEYLFPVNVLSKINVPKDIARSFETVHKETPGFDNYIDRLDDGKPIAVFYLGEGDNLQCLGLSRMLKLPYERSVSKLIESNKKYIKAGKEVKEFDGPDFGETLWGYTDTRMQCKSLKGRIHVSNSFSNEPIPDNKLLEIKGILGQPKPTFYPYYLLQDSTKYKTFNEAKDIAGRKLYRVHKLGTVTPLPQRHSDGENKKDNVTTLFKALPSGQEFTLYLRIHNLRPVEIGLLLSALTLHNSNKSFHNFGLAKGFGYGTLKIKNIATTGLSKSIIEYMKDFERQMNVFTKQHYHKKWCELEQIKSLINILSEHDDNDVQMPKLDNGDKDSKKRNDFRLLEKSNLKLEEKNVPITPLIDEKAEEKAAICDIYDKKIIEIKDLFQNKNYEQANEKCLNILKELTERKEEFLNTYHTQIDNIKGQISIAIEEELRKKKEEENIKKREKGLLHHLNEKYEMGPNIGNYKINNFALLKSKVEKWIKDKPTDSCLNEQEKIDLVEVIRRLRETPNKKERRDWDNSQSKLWVKIREWLGVDWNDYPF